MASVPITVLLYDGPLLCGFNVAIKGLIYYVQRTLVCQNTQFLIISIRQFFSTHICCYNKLTSKLETSLRCIHFFTFNRKMATDIVQMNLLCKLRTIY